MKYNPFRPNSPVNPGMFQGRQTEVAAIGKALFQTRHGNPQHILIEGERGLGKSSLMLMLSFMAKGKISIHGDSSQRVRFATLELELTARIDFMTVRVLC